VSVSANSGANGPVPSPSQFTGAPNANAEFVSLTFVDGTGTAIGITGDTLGGTDAAHINWGAGQLESGATTVAFTGDASNPILKNGTNSFATSGSIVLAQEAKGVSVLVHDGSFGWSVSAALTPEPSALALVPPVFLAPLGLLFLRRRRSGKGPLGGSQMTAI
jgi:hypothetical protein